MDVVGKVSVFEIKRDGKPTGRFRATLQIVDALGNTRPLCKEAKTAAIAKKAVEAAAREACRLRPSTEMTVGALCDAYLARCEAKERAAETMRDYRGIAKHITNKIGHVKISKLTPDQVEEMLSSCGGDKRKVNVRAFLRAAINKIAKRADPKMPNVAAIAEPPKYRPKAGVQLTEENFAKVLITETDPAKRAFWLLLADTGLRPVEARKLTWFEIDKRQDGYWIRLSGSKTEEGLKPVPVSDVVAKAIEDLPRKSSYIFRTSLKADGPYSETRWRDWWREIQEEAVVPVTVLYQLRHFFGTTMAAKVKRTVLARLLRHTDPRTSERYYVDHFDTELRKTKE